MVEDLVRGVDFAVAVLVNVDSFKGIAVGVIDLFVDVEAERGVAYLVFLDLVAFAERDA